MRHAVARFGNGVGLLVLHHLQAMFEGAQETIGLGKIARGVGAHMAGRLQGLERAERRGIAQRRIAPAQNQLLGLHEELDLADAAAPELDVVAGDRDLAMADMGVDLPLDRMDVLDGREIEIAPPDERRDGSEESRAGRGIAGAGARLDQRRALPVLTHLFVVVLGRFGRDGDLGGPRVGAQAQIDAEDVTLGVVLADQLDQLAHDVDGGGARIAALAEGEALGVVENDEVDVARIVEFEGAVLAHREHDQAGGGFQRRAVLLRQLRAARGFPQGEAQRALHAGVGEVGKRRGDIFQRPGSRDVRQRHGQRGEALRRRNAAMISDSFSAAAARASAMAWSRIALGPSANRTASVSMFAQRQPAEIGAVAESGFEQRARISLWTIAQLRQALEGAFGAGAVERLGQRGGGEGEHGRQCKANSEWRIANSPK